ncbi:MAG: dihydroxyacetone kinase subunit L [Verrucomicrobiales bacterium]|jgi:dihydroxyacetone kinase-like protein|nr:dihydroxyacetone kinase subunit L [Verrucomicrobiales bacterium]MDB2346721.1 dihydroxyacetone kinase subunit DhaL [Verrucomicrobiales bacterium]MDF1788611.1 dihydroxyacetone kinase subunit DhaL [Verrucomicrobiales bacterium]
MSKANLTLDEVVAMLDRVADKIIASEPELSEADRNIGDGDHGLGMQRGLTAAKEKLAEGGFPSIDKAFMAVGTAMMSSMGGASGAIFGTLFRAGGKALKGQDVFDSAGLATFLQAAVQGVQDRGKAEVGDKTVVDAMVPAAEKAKGTSEGNLTEALAAAADAAEGGKEASKDMVAKFGRAKTLGDGAVGHPDAGALSFTIIMQAMRDYVNE